MNTLTWFALEIILCLGLGWAVGAYLNPVLKEVLEHLCGSPLAARFWLTFTRLMLLLFPLMLVLWPDRHIPPQLELLAELLRGTLLRTLIGLILGLGVVAWNIWLFAAKPQNTPAPPLSNPQQES